MKRTILCCWMACAAAGAQTPTADLCTPPPGAAAPSLPARIMTGQGHLEFRMTTSSAKAQEFFDQGVAQMHSFWAVEAERSFLQAAELDPEAPMPQWGIAMVAAGDYRPRFQLEGDGPARRASTENQPPPWSGPARAATAAEKAVRLSQVSGKATALEKLYVAAIAARRNPREKDPEEAYIRGLRAIVQAYPQEIEARSYLALALMRGFTSLDKEPRAGSMEAVEILKRLLAEAPDHPGVHHYVIHAFEGSSFAKDAWPSCRRYPELAPNIPHALHMPGHIWAQTGKWEEAARAFEAAAENELGYLRADQLYSRGHHGHNVHFLVTTYNFQGRYDQAVEAARGLLALGENPREAAQIDNPYTAYRQGWFALLRTLVRFEKWDEILGDRLLPVVEKPREQAWRRWARGVAFSAKRDWKAARQEAAAMDQSLRELAAKTGREIPGPLAVARQELDGHIEYARGKRDRALRLLDAAAGKEHALRYNEPPAYPRPILEAMGKLALESARLEVAESAFREALEQYPESAAAKAGLVETLRRAHRPVSAGL